MLVEKLICNARLNLLILHPLPTPSQLPRQTEEPSGLSVLRCQGIKISISGRRRGEGRGVGESGGGRGNRSVGRTRQRSGRLGCRRRATECPPWLFPSRQAGRSPLPSLQTFIYLHYTSIYQPGKQNMSSWVPTSLTHTHTDTAIHPRTEKARRQS